MRCQQTNENCAWRWKQRKGKGSSKEEEITQKINTHHLGDSVASGSLKRREKVVEGEGFLLSFLAVSKKKKKKLFIVWRWSFVLWFREKQHTGS